MGREVLRLAAHRVRVQTLTRNNKCNADSACVCSFGSVLWHEHMNRPQHYLDSCTALLGYVGVIDHDKGYVSPHIIEKSGLVDKLEKVFKWERYYGSCGLFACGVPIRVDHEPSAFVVTKTASDWIEMAFEDRLYGDEMECG